MTVCNMSIEGGARCGYVNPDETTFEYLRGRAVRADRATRSTAPSRGGAAWRATPTRTTTIASSLDGASHRADRHLGHQPGPGDRRRRAHPASRRASPTTSAPASPRRSTSWSWKPGRADRRHEDRRRLHRLLHQRPHLGPARGGARRTQPARSPPGVRRSSCPARRRCSARRKRRACPRSSARPASSGASAGCSMCLAMNPDKLRRRRAVRVVEQPQLQGPPGHADRPHAADAPGHGGGRRHRGPASCDVREVL